MKQLRSFFLPCTIVIFVALFSAAGWAQTASVAGTVTDATGAVVVKAQVAVRNVETGQERLVETNDTGRYNVPALSPGAYTVTVTATGFEKFAQSGITLTVGRELVIDVAMRPGQVSERVEVSGMPSQVETASSSLSGLVDSTRVRALPLNGRSFDNLIQLQPGVSVATAAGNSPNQGRGMKFSVSGARLTSNYFMLDGTDINDSQNFTPGGAGGQLPGVEAIREFQVITHNAPAEYGRSSGGIINAVSKSGTNSLHGDVYEFLRNSVFDAKNYFDDPNQPIPLFIRNQFGASAGGPIKRDRLFFFGNYEGLRERLGVSKFASVPDQDARNGVINGKQVTVNPAVIPYLELYPMPNGPNVGAGVATLQFSQTQPASINYVTGKIDCNASSSDSVC